MRVSLPHLTIVLLAALACGCSPSTPSPDPLKPPPLSEGGCNFVPPTPKVYPPSIPPFAINLTPDPVLVTVSVGSGPAQMRAPLDITVGATTDLRGSITKVHRTLRARDTGEVLGDITDTGSFTYNGNTPCRSYDPLRLYGTEVLSNTYFPAFFPSVILGFDGRPAVLTVEVTVRDTAGADWVASKSVEWRLMPPT